MSQLQLDLKKLEEKRKKKMQLLLLGILLANDSQTDLLYNVKELTQTIIEEVSDIRQASFKIADKHSEKTHKESDRERNLIIAAAALYLTSTIVRRISVSTKDTFEQQAKESIKVSEATITRLVATEIYEANILKTRVNNPGKMLQWNAINDGKTCTTCRDLDQKIFKAEDTPAYPHANCRCMIDIIS